MLPFGALAVACLGRGGVCRAVVDVPLARLGSLGELAAAVAEVGWTLWRIEDRVEVRCPDCASAASVSRASSR